MLYNHLHTKWSTTYSIITFQAKTVQSILSRLETGRSDSEQLAALQQLLELSPDVTFAQEFFNHNGHRLVISMIESGTR